MRVLAAWALGILPDKGCRSLWTRSETSWRTRDEPAPFDRTMDALVRHGMINPEDAELFECVDEPLAALRILQAGFDVESEVTAPDFAGSRCEGAAPTGLLAASDDSPPASST